MKKSLFHSAALSLVMTCTACSAHAGDSPTGKAYMFASASSTRIDSQGLPAGVGFDGGTGAGYGVGGGYRATDNLAVEVGIQDGYKPQASRDGEVRSAAARDLSLAALVHLPMSDKFSWYVKAGVAHTVIGAGFGEVRATRPITGVGFQANFGRGISARAGFDAITKFAGQEQQMNRWTAAAMYSF